jgi:uncharacterized protein YdaU (DUF1376 family)
MSSDSFRSGEKLAAVAAILGAFLIVAALVVAMQRYTTPAPVDQGRAEVRAKALAELRAAETDALNNVAWQDKAKGIVRLRVEDAVKMVERDWSKDPVQARSNLIARVVKATAVAPKPPEKPSQFE